MRRKSLEHKAFFMREQWGNAGFGFESSQYLHQGGLYNLGISGEMKYRVLRGLELQVSAGAAW